MNRFLGYDFKNHSIEDCFFGFVPVPFEMTTSYGKGTKNGPEAIIAASAYVELFDEEYHFSPCEKGIWTFNEISFGECETIDECIHHIYTRSADLLELKKFMIFAGGEHSITLPIIKAYSENFEDLSILQFDAHADLRVSYEGSIYSHASVMRRVLEFCPAVQVGVRSLSEGEFNDISKLNTEIVYSRNIKDNFKGSIEKILENLSQNVYITFDLDGFDPSLMPSTGTPEPGGLLWFDVIGILERVFAEKNVLGVDVVELAPISFLNFADFTAARLIYKMMAMKLFFS